MRPAFHQQHEWPVFVCDIVEWGIFLEPSLLTHYFLQAGIFPLKKGKPTKASLVLLWHQIFSGIIFWPHAEIETGSKPKASRGKPARKEEQRKEATKKKGLSISQPKRQRVSVCQSILLSSTRIKSHPPTTITNLSVFVIKVYVRCASS